MEKGKYTIVNSYMEGIRMKKYFITVVFLGMVLVNAVHAAEGNLLINPGFETGDMTGWTEWWGGENIQATSDNPFTGNFAARNYYDGGKYQEVDVTSGLDYGLTGYGYLPSNGSSGLWGSFIGIEFIDQYKTIVESQEIDLRHLGESDTWNFANFGTLTAPDRAEYARITFGTWWEEGNNPAYPTDFDDFDFHVVPEPVSAVLMLIGGGTMVLRRRYKH